MMLTSQRSADHSLLLNLQNIHDPVPLTQVLLVQVNCTYIKEFFDHMISSSSHQTELQHDQCFCCCCRSQALHEEGQSRL